MLIAAFCTAAAAEKENLIADPGFSGSAAGWRQDNEKAFTVVKSDSGNILSVKGVPELGEKNRNLRFRQTIRLPKGTTPDDKFTFGVTIKATKVSGVLTASVYEVNGAGKITTRHVFRIRKRSKHNWKNFKREFSVAKDTKRLAIYIVASYLEGDDSIELKDIYLYRESGKAN